MVTIRIDDVQLRLWVANATSAGKLPALLAVLGRETRNKLRKHYLHKHATEPNKLGGDRTGFWRSVAQSVQSPVNLGTHAVSVGIAHPAIRQKVDGGRIVAKRARALTIPISAEAYGRTVSTFEHELGIKLFRLPSKSGNGLLAEAQADDRIKIHYVLRKSVDQKPDPDALPTEASLVTALVLRAQQWWNRVTGAK